MGVDTILRHPICLVDGDAQSIIPMQQIHRDRGGCAKDDARARKAQFLSDGLFDQGADQGDRQQQVKLLLRKFLEDALPEFCPDPRDGEEGIRLHGFEILCEGAE